VDLTVLAAALDQVATALIRTDRSNDAAWATILEAINTPVDTTGDGDPDGFVIPSFTPLDHPSFGGVTGETLASAVGAAGNAPLGYVLLADSQSMAEANSSTVDLTLVYVDLTCPDPEDADLFNTFMGRSFRCSIPEIAAIDVNLSIGNMDFSEFADYADERGGVFRGFAPSD
jgi:hypothetical protein